MFFFFKFYENFCWNFYRCEWKKWFKIWTRKISCRQFNEIHNLNETTCSDTFLQRSCLFWMTCNNWSNRWEENEKHNGHLIHNKIHQLIGYNFIPHRISAFFLNFFFQQDDLVLFNVKNIFARAQNS